MSEKEPPPLFDDDDSSRKDEESDIFASAVQSPMSEENEKPSHPLQDSDSISVPQTFTDPLSINEAKNDPLLQADHNLNPSHVENKSVAPDTERSMYHSMVDATQEISLNDDDEDDDTISSGFPAKLDPPTPTVESPASIQPEVYNESPTPTHAQPSLPAQPSIPEWTPEAQREESCIEITITDPQKIGEGMGAYMAYKLTTKTTLQFFRKRHWSVTRRFSDFLGLHSKLVEKHLHSGIIIPPAPEKAAIAATKLKLGTDKSADQGSTEFLERRRAALERFMNRTSMHPTLRADPDFREFLELDEELPKATQTSAMSSAGVLRLFNRVGETVNKMTFKMEENDEWFEVKTQQIENLEVQLKKLHMAMENLVLHRRELALSTNNFSKSAAYLSSVEEHSSLSRALHQLSETTDRVQTIQINQADADFYHLSENTKDYINMIGAVKDVFHERVKTYQTWQHAEAQLIKRRENKNKAEHIGRIDKVDQATEEVREWEAKVERTKEEFERISKSIKKEMAQFDILRVVDYKDMLVKYLESLITSQQQIVKIWEKFLPEAKAIA